jgi:hypothetical protein
MTRKKKIATKFTAVDPASELNLVGSSERLVIVVGEGFLVNSDPSVRQRRESLIAAVTDKFGALVLRQRNGFSLTSRVIYGPCLAVEVTSAIEELPEFNGDLISVNSSTGAPIAGIASLAVVTGEAEALLQSIAKS